MLARIAESDGEVLVTQSRHPFEVMLSSSQQEHDGWRNQAIALKFRVLSVRVASGTFVSNRKMSVMEIFQQLAEGTVTIEGHQRSTEVTRQLRTKPTCVFGYLLPK